MTEKLLLLLGSYIVGSLPFGLWLGLLMEKKDIRKYGSGNIGASNVLRTFGPKVGIPAFILDISKGLVPVLIAKHYISADYSSNATFIVAVGLAAILGHNFSLFLKFKGGKGIATSLGVCIAMSWEAGVAGFIAWLLVFLPTRYVSVASLVAVPVGSFAIWYFNDKALPFGLFGLAATIFSFVKHKANLERLKNGTEPKFGQKAKESAQ